jgi:hypothetical protein
MLSILLAGAGFFVKLIFFMPFSSVLFLGTDSSVNLRMPLNEHFLPRNNGSHSESIPRNFFLNEIPLPTLVVTFHITLLIVECGIRKQRAAPIMFCSTGWEDL